MIRSIRRLAVFCGSSSGRRPVYRETAEAFGRLLAARDIELVYGGGQVGLMGALAEAALRAGGRVVGIIPRDLERRELARMDLSELEIVESMHERKARMTERADAFVALPGGFGTYDEFCEALTWSQLGIHAKPIGVLNVEGFFDPLLAMLDRAVAEGFARDEHRALYTVAAEPQTLLAQIAALPGRAPEARSTPRP
jgi:uncharacterized protein (TIGR00730 family)